MSKINKGNAGYFRPRMHVTTTLTIGNTKKKAQETKFLLFHLIIFQLFFCKLRMMSPHLVLVQALRKVVTSNLSRNEVDVCRCLAIKVIVLLFKDGGRSFTSLFWNPSESSFLKPWIVLCKRNCTVNNK